jgi:hypothetical protein
VKSKEQALAMADALTAPANTKRRRQVEGRQQLLFGIALSAIPEANRPEVQESARRYAARRWYVYVPCVVMAALVLLVHSGQVWLGLVTTASRLPERP